MTAPAKELSRKTAEQIVSLQTVCEKIRHAKSAFEVAEARARQLRSEAEATEKNGSQTLREQLRPVRYALGVSVTTLAQQRKTFGETDAVWIQRYMAIEDGLNYDDRLTRAVMDDLLQHAGERIRRLREEGG